MEAEFVVIRRRRKGAVESPHGGAWKVAYADFVTAMMALFIVLWMYSAPEDTQKAISRYFRDAQASDKEKQWGTAYPGTGESASGEGQALQQKLMEVLKRNPEFEKFKANIQMTVTGEGLRVELIEDEEGTFFENGETALKGGAKNLLADLAGQLGQMPNRLVIEGHSDARQFRKGSTYGNWELSFDRAKAARKLMQEHGLKKNQVLLVSGFADCLPQDAKRPGDASNRRITVIVSYRHYLAV